MEPQEAGPIESFDFEIDLSRITALGLIGPTSPEAADAYERLGFSSAERLYHQLAGDLNLGVASFKPGDTLAIAGEDVINAYIVRNGTLESRATHRSFRLGPGSVIGLAEGLALRKHGMTVTALSEVSVSTIPIYRALRALYRMHKGLKGITRNTVMRILQITETPETFK